MEIPRLSPDEIKQFARDYCDDKIVTSTDVIASVLSQLDAPESDEAQIAAAQSVRIVFPTVAMAGLDPETITQVGTIYEYLDKRGPRNVNGLPVFLSGTIMHVEDWKVAIEQINAEIARRDEVQQS